ncbi:MAG: MarR family transcriptional regulator [Coriobacteriia bacterium]|nr:MarR family transcriptional regulator [Coriobacteriia bacterium]
MEERFETFTILINRINRNVRKIKNKEMAEYGLKGIHVSCLHYLGRQEGLSPTQLSEECEEDKAAVSRALDYLEAQGFVEARPQSDKRYKCPIVLTDKGQRASTLINSKIEAILAEINDSLTEDERETFYRSLSAISNRLDEISQEASRL